MKTDLPGNSTFDRLTPLTRRDQSEFTGARIPTAATLVVTYGSPIEARLILTRRTVSLRRHPGQIAFPGGMIEPGDQSPLDAAFRETREEIGLVVTNGLRVCPLSAVETFISGVIIQPYWVHLPASPRLRADPGEVDEILRVPIEDLRAAGALRSMPHPRFPDRQILAYHWNGSVIWGATARTVGEVLAHFSRSPG